MEKIKRTPIQGVWNIIRFNWHFYFFAIVFLTLCASGLLFTAGIWVPIIYLLICLAILPIVTSLIVSFYVYDLSGFYRMNWLDSFSLKEHKTIANITAGFDETSELLEGRFNPKKLNVLDFYNPQKHTEISIRRARKAGLIYPETITFDTSFIPLEEASQDYIFILFALHEIRNEKERIVFLGEIKSKLKTDGKIIIVEHLRDLPNFLAYTLGFFHFYSLRTWHKNMKEANLIIEKEVAINSFVHIFVAR